MSPTSRVSSTKLGFTAIRFVVGQTVPDNDVQAREAIKAIQELLRRARKEPPA